MKPTFSLLLTTVLTFAVTTTLAEVHTFTSSAGTTLRGDLVSVKGDMVTIKKEDGQTLTLKMSVFSQADQTWLQSQAGPAPAAADPAQSTTPSTAAIFSKSAPPLPYADMVQEIRWKGQPVRLEYRGPLAASVKPLGQIKARVRSLAFHPDGRLAFTFGDGAGENMGIGFWDGKGGTSPFLKLTYQPAAPGDPAQRADAEAHGNFGFFVGSLAFDRGGRCFFASNSGSSADAIWLVKTTAPVLLEHFSPVSYTESLQIPAFDETYLYGQRGGYIKRLSLDKPKSWTEWFQFKGKDAYLDNATMLDGERILGCMRIKPPGSPPVDPRKPFPFVYQTLLLDLQQQACWLLPDNEPGPMAVARNGGQIVKFHTLTKTLVELSLPSTK